ncbi:hypothetical protein [Cellulomonas terrae]|uniref:Gram-positive cocci surface proteins LPxTG domain-containing protein n=1 Tax=Cellulomonas terrae TaxID=311234 RepID=A0A511JFL9_9CELL|nr:hypothetical protein [Cellulomonas terrae]GEL96746.1 hypothetical protein CTE05_02930 [Cellulomonas terrae]
MIGRRAAALLSAGLLAGLLTALPAGPAYAADPLEVSLDGTTWTASLPTRLFPSPGVIVPGDVLTSVLWVRNGSGDPARVDLEVADDLGVGPGSLAADLSLVIDGTPAPGGTSWHGPDLAPGAVARIPLVVTFAASSQSVSQESVAAVLDSVTLVQTGVGPAPTPTPRQTPQTPPTTSARGGLAHTGADLGGALGVASAAVGAGFLLLLAARRRARRAES